MIRLVGEKLRQWDVGRSVEIAFGKGKELETVRFWKSSSHSYLPVAFRTENGVNVADIPNVFLKDFGTLTIEAVTCDEFGNYGSEKATVYVHKRAKPADYEYTETDVECSPINVPTNVSAFTNDAGYAKTTDIPSVEGLATEKYVDNAIAGIDIPEADVPSALPNPNALTFTGAVEATYDGSEAVSVEIPSGGGSGATSYYKVASLTTEEEVLQITLPLSTDAIAKLNAANAWILEIYMNVSGSMNTETSLGSLTAETFSTWGTNTFFTALAQVVPTTGVAYASESRITALYKRGINDGAATVFTTYNVKNHGVKSAFTEVRGEGRTLTTESLRITGSINLPVGTRITLYAVGEAEVIEI